MTGNKLWSYGLFALAFAALLTNFGVPLFSPIDVGDVSSQVQPVFIPADAAFAIWSLIFPALVVSGWWATRHADHDVIRRMRVPAALNLITLIIWTPLFILGQELVAQIIITLMLVTLIATHIQIGVGTQTPTERAVRQFVVLPWSIYFGWISVANIASLSRFLLTQGTESLLGIDGAGWAVILCIVAALLGVAIVTLGRRSAYGLVFVWALSWVAINRPAYPEVVAAAIGAAVVVGVAVVVRGLRLANIRGTAGTRASAPAVGD